MVLCHPHPEYGGTMRSLVISALFSALPAAGVTCLRFNFRGVERSEGRHHEGRGERRTSPRIEDLGSLLAPTSPLVLTGWSFGADVALSVVEERVDAWHGSRPRCGTRPGSTPSGATPARSCWPSPSTTRSGPLPRCRGGRRAWTATEIERIRGASHFFMGRTDRWWLATQLVGRPWLRRAARARGGGGQGAHPCRSRKVCGAPRPASVRDHGRRARSPSSNAWSSSSKASSSASRSSR